MKTITIIILVILLIGIFGGIFYLNHRFEKPKEAENVVNLVDLSIFAQEGDKLVRTNYTILVDGFFLSSGVTNEYGAVLSKVPLNASITIKNNNLPGQTYYKTENYFYTEKNETTRVVLRLVSVGELKINATKENYKFNVSVSSEGYFKNTIICLGWSSHVIFAEIEGLSRIENIENNTKCYQSSTIDNSQVNFTLKYNTFGTITSEDYINLIFYDFDKEYTRRQTHQIVNI